MSILNENYTLSDGVEHPASGGDFSDCAQQAIEMSDIIPRKKRHQRMGHRPRNPDQSHQGPEIRTMSGWLAGWGDNPSTTSSVGHGTGGGMTSQADMDTLQKANGDDAARLFRTGMITRTRV